MSTSKNRMRAFRARRARIENAEQKEARLTADARYRRQRLSNLHANETSEEKKARLASRSQYEVQRLADKRARENADEREERLRAKRAKEVSRRECLRMNETRVERTTRLERDRDEHRWGSSFLYSSYQSLLYLSHRSKTRAKNESKLAAKRNCGVCGYIISTTNYSHIAINSLQNLHLLRPGEEWIPRSVLKITFSRFTSKNLY
jgi:hypothetical protein